jgi:hypothetical protein
MNEKKNGDYEKPESHGEDDELEGVSGGDGAGEKKDDPNRYYCKTGRSVTDCKTGTFIHW